MVGADRAVARRSASGKVNWASAATVTLTNRGAFSFPWLLESSAPWLGVAGARVGQLRPGASLEVGLQIDPATAPPERGVHLAELRVLNALTFHSQAAVEVTWIAEGGPTEPIGLDVGLEASGRDAGSAVSGAAHHAPPDRARHPAQR